MNVTDISDIPVSPRKKLKVQHTLGDVMDHLSPVQVLRADDQSHSPNTNLPGTSDKEAECGITEYVSPDLSGFVGVLKKRYDAPT